MSARGEADQKDKRFRCGRRTPDGPKVGYRVVLYHGHPCKRFVKNEGDHCWQHGGPKDAPR